MIVSNDGWLGIETTNVPHIDSIGWFMENNLSGESWLSSTTEGLVASVFFDGCIVSSDPSVVVSSNEHEFQARLTMAPNPASQFVDITLSSPMPISIWDTQGRLMHSNNSSKKRPHPLVTSMCLNGRLVSITSSPATTPQPWSWREHMSDRGGRDWIANDCCIWILTSGGLLKKICAQIR